MRRKRMRVFVKVYLPKYDTQGDSVEVPEEITDRSSWDAFKQTMIEDFIQRHEAHFEKSARYGGASLDTFGKGHYKNNEMNRRLGRVGMPYDKGASLRERIMTMVRNRTVEIENEDAVLRQFRRFWTSQDEDYLRKMIKGKILSYKAVSKRLFRTRKALYQRKYIMKKKGRW